MLDSVDTWANTLKNEDKPNDIALLAVKDFADVIGELMNKVQPNIAPPFVYSGQIFAFNSSVFAAQLVTLTPTQSIEWVDKIVNAWLVACQASVITPSTVTNATVWTASTTDTATLPSASVTITTLSAAATLLKSGLISASVDLSDADASRRKFVDAFRSATLEFSFTLIGLALALPGPPISIPVVFPAA